MNKLELVKRGLYMAVLLIWATGCVVVEDGEVGISKSFGNINDTPLAPGIHANVPLIREVEVWNIKTQRLSRKLDIPSGEGLIVGIETTLLFRPVEVVQLRKTVGSNYILVVLESTLINTFRETIGKQRVEDLIKNQERLTSSAEELLRVQLKGRGIEVEQLLVTGLGLPSKVKDAIERKLESEQKALQKEFELQQAKKDAEIEVARAKGVAQAQEIISSTISDAYLQYLWISTLNDNPNVVYVATEANMPLFRSTKEPSKVAPKPKPTQ